MKMTARRPSRTEQMVAETAEWVPAAPGVDGVVSAVAVAPLFAGMSRGEIAQVLVGFEQARFPSDRRIVLEGLRGSDFFLVVAGSASVLVDGSTVARLGPGDFFGEIAILGDGLRSASVRADTPLHCLVLPNGKLEHLLLDHPQVGLNLIHTVIGRYQGVAGRRPVDGAEATPTA